MADRGYVESRGIPPGLRRRQDLGVLRLLSGG